ncbi:ras-responsive element-binding protein 1-like [Schistocerca americana]|uniref:ras-responsive element-binding protein 1-like n=1 Tax=Schistocerca americana TaxID=7009 RepID=UPI001F4FF985|nr:ras-responsive element-binding protein 1-like [Schistocerca americana]
MQMRNDGDGDECTGAGGGAFGCPACSATLPSQHALTLHLRSEQHRGGAGAPFPCGVCGKALSSASSRDRHALVHSRERPFQCRVCGVAFTTNGNMHRHLRTHDAAPEASPASKRRRESCGSSSSSSSGGSSRAGSTRGSSPPSPTVCNKRKVEEDGDACETSIRQRLRGSVGAGSPEDLSGDGKLQCPVCERHEFPSVASLELHINKMHPGTDTPFYKLNQLQDNKIRCDICGAAFRNSRDLDMHRYAAHDTVVGFQDLTFVDFSSSKFPHIARAVCEQSLHRPSKATCPRFQCLHCHRSFPCDSALKIHIHAGCGLAATTSSDSAESDGPTDLSCHSGRRQVSPSESEDETPEEKKRHDFFSCLDLRNKVSSQVPYETPSPGPQFKEDSLEQPSDFSNFDQSPQMGTRDLADIQSMISVTSVGGILPELSKSPSPPPPPSSCHSASGDLTPPDSAVKEEEQQDLFAAEFRRMKLRGEFPCRLCDAVFPNLRALKGHSRAHLSAGCCNVCPFTHSDRTILLRHMRSHNGDRPYECALCNYAFTTKANCERHLRNRHSKLSRDDVKKSIIYHPSEDPTNDPELQGKITTKLDVKRSLVFASGSSEEYGTGHLLSTALSHSRPDITKETTEEAKLDIPMSLQERLRPTATTDTTNNDSVKTPLLIDKPDKIEDPTISCNTLPQVSEESVMSVTVKKEENEHEHEPEAEVEPEDVQQNIQDKETLVTFTNQFSSLVSQSQRPICTSAITCGATPYGRDVNSPLDLSMDALDLRKKKKKEPSPSPPPCHSPFPSADDDDEDAEKPQDLSKKSATPVSSSHYTDKIRKSLFGTQVKAENQVPLVMSNSPGSILAQHILNTVSNHASNLPPHLNQNPPQSPNTDVPATRYFPQFGSPYISSIFPYFLMPSPSRPIFPPTSNLQEVEEMKERLLQKELIREIRLTCGGKVLSAVPGNEQINRHPQTFQDSSNDFSSRNASMKLKQEIDTNVPVPVAEKADIIHHMPPKPVTISRDLPAVPSSSVKMVIKNGVLMPKQKQRRYRTERPFACEHCSARFTLRSNMERHIKQQHPQLWSQRQRTVGGPGRRPQPPPNVTCTDMQDVPHLLTIPRPVTEVLKEQQRSTSSNNCTIFNSSSVTSTATVTPTTSIHIAATAVVPTTGTTVVTPATSMRNEDNSHNTNNCGSKTYISDEVKHAIAQQLKSKLSVSADDADDEAELVIDESEQSPNPTPQPPVPSITVVSPEELEMRAGVGTDLASVSRLLDAANQQTHAFQRYFKLEDNSEEDEDGLVAGSSDENRSETELTPPSDVKKKSAYSLAPNRVSCPYCNRKFPWSSSLRRHVLTHTGQKPFKCKHCPLLFTTKSNCDRHLLRKHGGSSGSQAVNASAVGSASSSGETSPGAVNSATRNVPERPYKCHQCPSSTFSTQSNLRKHLSTKHGNQTGSSPTGSGSDEPSSADPEVSVLTDSPPPTTPVLVALPPVPEASTVATPAVSPVAPPAVTVEEASPTVVPCIVPSRLSSQLNQTSSAVDTLPSSELPFKCHLCDGSYAERQDALNHIQECHTAEFELLVMKGALEAAEDNNNISNSGAMGVVKEEGNHTHVAQHNPEEGMESARGKFPDYANRKVMCAFCMRRFWSAEDLRRHMRTHTGERPFSCDVCRRRFTLKHSMLRHRKKHGGCAAASVTPLVTESDGCVSVTDNNHPPGNNNNNNSSSNNNNINSNNNNNDDATTPSVVKGRGESEDASDLIGNLLGIQDRSIIDKALQARSADDAAKLLGVKQ